MYTVSPVGLMVTTWLNKLVEEKVYQQEEFVQVAGRLPEGQAELQMALPGTVSVHDPPKL